MDARVHPGSARQVTLYLIYLRRIHLDLIDLGSDSFRASQPGTAAVEVVAGQPSCAASPAAPATGSTVCCSGADRSRDHRPCWWTVAPADMGVRPGPPPSWCVTAALNRGVAGALHQEWIGLLLPCLHSNGNTYEV